MKKFIGSGLVLALGLAACHSSTAPSLPGPDSFTISGTLNGLDTGEIRLIHAESGAYVMDSSRVEQGKFFFSGDISEPTVYYLELEGDMQGLQFFVQSGALTIKASVDSLNKAVVEGSPAETEYLDYRKQMEPYDRQLNALDKVYEDAQKTGTLKQLEDSLDQISDRIDSAKTEALKVYVAQYPKSVVGAWAVLRSDLLYNPDPKTLGQIYFGLDSSIRQTAYGRDIDSAYLMAKKLAVGQLAPDFSEADTSGKPLALSSLRGHYVLLDFWASWCGPCRMENPHVVKAFQDFKTKGFTVLGVSLDQNKDSWEQAIRQDHLNWHQVSDLQYWKNAVAVQYGIRAIPSNFLLDKNGIILARNLRGNALESKLTSLLH